MPILLVYLPTYLPTYLPEASLGPYAWEYKRVKAVRSYAKPLAEPELELAYTCLPLENGSDWGGQVKPAGSLMFEDRYLQYEDLRCLPRSQDVFRKIEMDSSLLMTLPKPGATSGLVLQHSINTFERLLLENKPMTFKFGFCHDAAVRWHNAKFGYKHSREKFDYMLVLYAASNPHGPAFLEAALIERFSSDLFAWLEFQN